MKQFAKTYTVLMGLVMVLGLSQGCRKYNDGPAVSFRSRTERVSNEWRVDRYIRNGSDETQSFKNGSNNYQETYTKNGAYSYSYTDFLDINHSNSGQWQFQNNENEIIRFGMSGKDSEILTILRLTEDEFWYWVMESGDKVEYRMVPN